MHAIKAADSFKCTQYRLFKKTGNSGNSGNNNDRLKYLPLRDNDLRRSTSVTAFLSFAPGSR
jgi:hypothetical protein